MYFWVHIRHFGHMPGTFWHVLGTWSTFKVHVMMIMFVVGTCTMKYIVGTF